MSISPEIDTSTVRRVAAGDVAASHELVVMYQDRVVALCYGIAGDRDEDAAHAVALDVFLLIFAHLKKLPGVAPARMSTWILTIAAKRAVAVEHAKPALVAPAVDCDLSTTAATAHPALLALPADVLAARAWDELHATPDFADRVVAAAVRKSAEAAVLARARSTTFGFLGSSSVRRLSVVIALVTLVAFAKAMLHSSDGPEKPRPTPAEMLNKGSASSLSLPPAGPVTVAAPQAELAALRAHAQAQGDEIAALKARIAQLQAGMASTKYVDQDTGYPYPRPEVLQRWATQCRVRFDDLDVLHLAPLQLTAEMFGVTAAEVGGFNAAMREVHATWLVLVRAAYVELTGDRTGANTLSPKAMIADMNNQAVRQQINALHARLANERAGLVPAPAVNAAMSAFERYYRAYAKLGDTIETAVAARIGTQRARTLRGNGWDHQFEATGCMP